MSTVMGLWQGFAQAFDEMRHHKLRTALTLLGMIFGVGAVIAMLSVGEGAEREALKMIDSMGCAIWWPTVAAMTARR